MRTVTFYSALALFGFFAASVEAVDLTKIDRSIRHEPTYQSKDPRYCLLVFGPEAQTHVWLVTDGDVLYVDRNGDGDLTEPSDRIEPRYALHNAPERPDMKVMTQFFLMPRIKDGQPEGEPILSCVPDSTALIVEHLIPTDDREDTPAKQYRKCPFRVDMATKRYEQDSSLAFASRSSDAPILYYDGPRQLALHPYSQTMRRGETSWLEVQLRTPGLGASTRMLSADGMKDVHPVAEIECPLRWPGAEPVRFRLELPGRG